MESQTIRQAEFGQPLLPHTTTVSVSFRGRKERDAADEFTIESATAILKIQFGYSYNGRAVPETTHCRILTRARVRDEEFHQIGLGATFFSSADSAEDFDPIYGKKLALQRALGRTGFNKYGRELVWQAFRVCYPV